MPARFLGQLDFGLKGGFKLPSGLNAGQQVELLLDSIALPYYGVQTFDDLPTPFRCVATDIRAGEAVVLGSGSFALALRATMSIPAAFTPVALDNRLLVDGGALNNVPADVVKAMGAQVAIAVNVSSSTDESPPPSTIFAVLGQTLDSLMTLGTREALKSADLVIVPNLQGLTGGIGGASTTSWPRATRRPRPTPPRCCAIRSMKRRTPSGCARGWHGAGPPRQWSIGSSSKA